MRETEAKRNEEKLISKEALRVIGAVVPYRGKSGIESTRSALPNPQPSSFNSMRSPPPRRRANLRSPPKRVRPARPAHRRRASCDKAAGRSRDRRYRSVRDARSTRLSQNATLPGSHLKRTVNSGRVTCSHSNSSSAWLSRGVTSGDGLEEARAHIQRTLAGLRDARARADARLTSARSSTALRERIRAARAGGGAKRCTPRKPSTKRRSGADSFSYAITRLVHCVSPP